MLSAATRALLLTLVASAAAFSAPPHAPVGRDMDEEESGGECMLARREGTL